MAAPIKAPSRAALHEAAIAHLARYAATRAGLTRVLDRRVERWARAVPDDPDAVAAAKQAVRDVVAALTASGVLDDAGFAASRARSLIRAGRSRMAVAAHLAARGVDPAIREALPDDAETELAAALVLVRRRRFGAFRAAPADEARLKREFGVLARAGFSQEIASRALRMDVAEAETRVHRLRRE
jgi:regulatory protein